MQFTKLHFLFPSELHYEEKNTSQFDSLIAVMVTFTVDLTTFIALCTKNFIFLIFSVSPFHLLSSMLVLDARQYGRKLFSETKQKSICTQVCVHQQPSMTTTMKLKASNNNGKQNSVETILFRSQFHFILL